MKLLVGCPVRNRNWILPLWRKHVENAVPGNWDIEYVFVVGDDDAESIDLLNSWKRTTICYVTEPEVPLERSWVEQRLLHMVDLRNVLLQQVRQMQPDLFFSLDSDILIDIDLIRNLSDSMEKNSYDAIGGLTYLDPVDKKCTNLGVWKDTSRSTFNRVQSPGIHEVDILMAIKLMNRSAYNVDYVFHKLGEDMGWSVNVKRAGLLLGCDGRVASKHVMSEEALDRLDKRVGW